MKGDPADYWTIDALGAETERALAVNYEGPPNDRVREIPDLRTIRYYTTLGLIDRPLAMRGRTALYGRRHLLQLVAIKRLQARGLTLADVQRHLVGLTDAALERLARVTPAKDSKATEERAKGGTSTRAPRRREPAFWKSPPAEAMAADARAPDNTFAEASSSTLSAPRALQGVRLHDDLTMLVAAGRHLNDDDVRAIHAAARGLIQQLEQRGLIRPRDERTSS